MMGVARLSYLGLNASDLGAWKKFGTEVLGFEIGTDSQDRLLYLRGDERHHRLTIHAGDEDDVSYVGWELASHEVLEAAAGVLESQGVQVQAGMPDELAERRVLEFVYFTCPYTGVRMELTVGNETLLYPRFTPTRALSGFLMGELGLGHVVLISSDVQAAARFYVRALGFGVSDYVLAPDGAPVGAFLHCNPRHHSLAFFGMRMSPRKIQHLMIETNSLDDVGTSYDLCLERKITKSSLGRHPDDRGLSFYFRSPSRWLFEYGWQLRSIDPANWTTERYVMGAGNGWGHAGLFSPDE
ncbi:MAG TPA: VOC family protein [Candidatus Eisenbacteria bacterium]|nr:VOC family protein [Candidatus Eisenbacteria bacterium]